MLIVFNVKTIKARGIRDVDTFVRDASVPSEWRRRSRKKMRRRRRRKRMKVKGLR